jgi:hypothetical protein
MQFNNSTVLRISRPRFSPTRHQRPHRLAANEDRAAQRAACYYLTEACERALFDLRSSLATAETPAEIRTGLAAADLLGDVLLAWRDALNALN